MTWLNQRQGVLSQNVANADTPGYAARDVQADRLQRHPQGYRRDRSRPCDHRSAPHRDQSRHDVEDFENADSPDTRSNPNGNTISLEQEMIKVSDTQAQYAAATGFVPRR